MADDRLYFKQLLSGHDFAAGDMIATQMRNFAYLIGDRETGDAVVVDPAYAAGELVDTLETDGMRLSGVLVTHHHPDHVGGTMMGLALLVPAISGGTKSASIVDTLKAVYGEVERIRTNEVTDEELPLPEEAEAAKPADIDLDSEETAEAADEGLQTRCLREALGVWWVGPRCRPWPPPDCGPMRNLFVPQTPAHGW